MAQTREGAIKLSANYYHLSPAEYVLKIKTQNYCNKCKQWRPNIKFCIDNSRSTGLHKNCNDCRWVNGGKKRGFVKGCVSIFKGKKHNQDAIQKMRIANKGENNPNWKGGITNLIMQIRNTAEFKSWRKNIYYAGGFTCQKCKVKKIGKNIIIDADHIYPLSRIISDKKIKTVEESLFVPEIWDLKNGRCLCRKCHKETKTWGVNATKKIKNGKE